MTDPGKPSKPSRPVPSGEQPVDPGFWRRPLSSRMVWVLIAAAAVVLAAGVVVSLALGVRLF